MNVALRFSQFSHRVEQLQGPANLAALLKPNAAKPVIDAIDRLDTALAEVAAAVRTALNPPRDGKYLTLNESVDSLAPALAAVARERRCLRVPADSIRDLIVDEVPEDHRSFWSTGMVGYISGLISSNARLKAVLKSSDVLVWRNQLDGDIRLVDARWCRSPEAIYSHVTDTTFSGRRCRFCTMEENPAVPELQPVDPDQRKGFDMLNETFVLNLNYVYTHEACRPYWEKWCDIAAQFAKEHSRG